MGCNAQDRLSFTLPASITIENAEALAAEFKQLPLAEKTRLTLDASAVEYISTPGLQLIIALEKSLAAQGGSLVVTGKRASFIQSFTDAGLEGLLEKLS